MKRFLILIFLTIACSGPPVEESAKTSPVQPLLPPNAEVERMEVPRPAQSGTATLAVVDVPLPPAEEVPEFDWEKEYFESIAEREKLSGMRPLRSKVVPKGDLELRVWRGFGLSLLEGFVLRRSGDRWSAVDLGWASSRDGKGKNRVALDDRKLAAPVAGWDDLWQRLSDTGMLTLPRKEKTTCPYARVTDGFSYVIEHKANGKYGNYMYDNPDGSCDEERRILRILEIINEEFYSH